MPAACRTPVRCTTGVGGAVRDATACSQPFGSGNGGAMAAWRLLGKSCRAAGVYIVLRQHLWLERSRGWFAAGACDCTQRRSGPKHASRFVNTASPTCRLTWGSCTRACRPAPATACALWSATTVRPPSPWFPVSCQVLFPLLFQLLAVMGMMAVHGEAVGAA